MEQVEIKFRTMKQKNLERAIFRNFKIANIKITKDQLFDHLIFDFLEII